MSVDLTLLPATLPKIKKFNFWFWAILFIIFIVIGCLLTLALSFFYPISNPLFIIGGLILPVALWVFVFLYGIYYRGYKEAYIKKWNEQRELRRQQLITYARRGLYLLNYSLITEHGQGYNARGIVENQFSLTAKRPSSGGALIPHSALPTLPHIGHNLFYERLKVLFTDWQHDNKDMFKYLSDHFKIHVRLFIDVAIDVPQIEKLWLETLANSIKSVSFHIEDPKNSACFMEQWLDNSEYDNDILLIINTHLFNAPTKNEAESALFMLFAGEQLRHHVNLPVKESNLIKVYRSEQTKSWHQTIDNALLWGQEVKKKYDGVWYSNMTTEQNIEIMNYFNEIEFDYGRILNIDTAIGDTKKSAYFLALALAAEHALKTANSQLIIIGDADITASVVTSITRELT